MDVERNRARLLEAAAEAMAQNPGWSMTDVAQVARLTRATLYRHFGTREKLLAALRAEALNRAAEAIAGSRPDEGDAVDALRRAVEAVVSHGARFRSLLVEDADQDPSFGKERERVFAPLLSVIRRGQETGQIRRDLPPEWVLTAMTSLLTAGVRATRSPWYGDSSVADLVLTVLIEGVGPRR
ncbi:TetR/AcrR family transcriptional regulator [Actinomycetospora cinnamomea]|uniref:TetR family transcriptional regulator n=1 Tax=Actinomycetospora cinnamomea TaxID=663609 RepID=A0A2U1FAB7_9PSEU|nr:TetR/AcrR family transcriptional regulator [Actinomycetospora cinnamomea]PVZ09122.1 TetR family transcriptional regulator [Actinomycetospora cinnamomea]